MIGCRRTETVVVRTEIDDAVNHSHLASVITRLPQRSGIYHSDRLSFVPRGLATDTVTTWIRVYGVYQLVHFLNDMFHMLRPLTLVTKPGSTMRSMGCNRIQTSRPQSFADDATTRTLGFVLPTPFQSPLKSFPSLSSH